MVKDGAFSNKIDYVKICKEILNCEVYLNCLIGSKVTAILVNKGVLPSGGASLGRVYVCSLRSRLVIRALHCTVLQCTELHCTKV